MNRDSAWGSFVGRSALAMGLVLGLGSSGCILGTGAFGDHPRNPAAFRTSATADKQIELQAQGLSTDAEFFVDGLRVGRGRSVSVVVDDTPHEIAARAEGYTVVKHTVNPPFRGDFPYTLTFLVEHQLRHLAEGQVPPGERKLDGDGPGGRRTGASEAGNRPPLAVAVPQSKAYGLVIGVERYRDAPSPVGARGDAEDFARVLTQTLGIPASNVHVALDDRATKGDVDRELAWIMKQAGPGDRIYFFYSGHGAPDAASQTPYLLPYDGDPRYVRETAMRLGDVLERLSQSKAKETFAFVDSCFSGVGGRSVLPPGARPLVAISDPKPSGAVALFSASAGNQISGPTQARDRGAFSRYLVEGLGTGAADADGDGQITLGELSAWVSPRVQREAKLDNREQTPTLTVGRGVDPAAAPLAWGLTRR
jgi:hypothetical protein